MIPRSLRTNSHPNHRLLPRRHKNQSQNHQSALKNDPPEDPGQAFRLGGYMIGVAPMSPP